MTVKEAITHCYEISSIKCDAGGAELKQLKRLIDLYGGSRND